MKIEDCKAIIVKAKELKSAALTKAKDEKDDARAGELLLLAESFAMAEIHGQCGLIRILRLERDAV